MRLFLTKSKVHQIQLSIITFENLQNVFIIVLNAFSAYLALQTQTASSRNLIVLQIVGWRLVNDYCAAIVLICFPFLLGVIASYANIDFFACPSYLGLHFWSY